MMRKLTIRLTGFVTAFFILLIGWLTPAYATTCPAPVYHVEQAELQLACVQFGRQTLSMHLKYDPSVDDQNVHLALTKLGNAQCTPLPGQCARLDAQLELTMPLFLSNQPEEKHHVTLRHLEKNGDAFWILHQVEPLDTQNPIVLEKITSNPQGEFTQLYALKGDFSHFPHKKEFKIAPNVNPPTATLQNGETYALKIFHFNDLHNNLRVTNSARGDTHYLSQMVKIVKNTRQQAKNNTSVLFLSAGDDHIGNPLDELLGAAVGEFKASASYRAYSAAGVDAAVLGNHEFDRGTEILAKAIESDANFPLLSANIFGSRYLNDKHYSPAIIGVTKSGVRVGILGLTTKISTRLGSSDDPNSNAEDMAKVATRAIPYLEPLVDVIVILSHVGYNAPIDGAVRHALELGDVQIAEAAAFVSDLPMVLIGGHTHTVLNAQGLDTFLSGIPTVQAGSSGSHLGEFSYTLFPSTTYLRTHATARLHGLKRRDQRPATINAENYNPALYEQDSDVDLEFEQSVIQPLYDLLKVKLSELIGQAGNSDELTTESVIAKRYLGQTAIHNFMNDAIVARSVHFPLRADNTQQVDIAVFNASGVSRGVVPNQMITFEDWFQVMPFADLIVVINMTGAEIKQMLMSNAQRILRPEQLAQNGGTATPEDLAGFVYSYGFLQFSKDLKYTIRLNDQPKNAVAEAITIQGRPIDEVLDQTFRVAFGDFIALRGGGSENWRGQTTEAGQPALGFDLTVLPKDETGLIYRNEIIQHIRNIGAVDESTGAVVDDRLTIIP
ncbi:bifunctional metallophosphatase/5'-nucleotidase [Thioflexithrix psekupsensis]|uniref:Uncharacterized protein n=1 Tax=Thioflexithrix psekupsensis TaxID=1570016 RepID=A0A251X6L2_9GAMM|nr:5'-nucleotidase C-terminal domain-containing protein [Thioflexithrix psekupsensis]OUD12937.1 hypothetical protein TPSD3_12420 [Thioflexithrix psekupsensis]